MLGVADVCPSCGETHPEPQFGISHGGPRECPRVIMGSFPVFDEFEPETVPAPVLRASAAQKIRDFEIPVQVAYGSLPVPHREPLVEHPRSLSVPWLRPPDLGEVL